MFNRTPIAVAIGAQASAQAADFVATTKTGTTTD